MKHECKYKDEDGLSYFEEAIIDGVIEYDDFFDAYLWFGYIECRFLGIFKRRWGRVDILIYCPFCGKKIYNKSK